MAFHRKGGEERSSLWTEPISTRKSDRKQIGSSNIQGHICQLEIAETQHQAKGEELLNVYALFFKIF